MSEQQPGATPRPPVTDHRCMVCRKHASFGFTTRRGVVWTCLSHREAGEAVLVAPSSAGAAKAPPA